MNPVSINNIGNHNISNIVLYCLLDEIDGPTASLENARDFLFLKKLLKSSLLCLQRCPWFHACPPSLPMDLFSAAAPAGSTIILEPTELSRQKTFLPLLFCLSMKGLTGNAISKMSGISENMVADWRTLVNLVVLV